MPEADHHVDIPTLGQFEREPSVKSEQTTQEVDGACVVITRSEVPAIWSAISPEGLRYARVVPGDNGTYCISVYERVGSNWIEVEDPWMCSTVETAKLWGQSQLASW